MHDFPNIEQDARSLGSRTTITRYTVNQSPRCQPVRAGRKSTNEGGRGAPWAYRPISRACQTRGAWTTGSNADGAAARSSLKLPEARIPGSLPLEEPSLFPDLRGHFILGSSRGVPRARPDIGTRLLFRLGPPFPSLLQLLPVSTLIR